MSIDVRHLRYFVAVAEERSFTAGAARLRIDQPAVSRAVQQLERELGVRLLERTTRHVALTHAGKSALDRCRRILADLDEMVITVRGAARELVGELNLGLVHDVQHVVADLVTGYRIRYPGVAVTLWTGSQRDILNEMEKGGTDVMLTWGGPPASVRHPRRVIATDQVVVAVPSGHPLAARRTVALNRLGGATMLLPDPAGAHDFHDFVLDAVVAPAGAHATTVPMVDSGQEVVLRAAAARGVAAVVTRTLFRRRRPSGLVARPLTPDLVVPVTMIWREEVGPVLQAFLAQAGTP
jgi:DNA-binding transcriptional LysR family regulator